MPLPTWIRIMLSEGTPDLCVYLRAALLNRGVLKQENDHLVFQQDYKFSSPSAAASVIVGGSANGRISWKTKDNKTLKEYQEMQLPAQ